MLIITPDGYVIDDGTGPVVEHPAMVALDALLTSLPGYSLLTNEMKQKALSTALVPDAAGVWPGKPGYVMTFDPYWAAIGLIGFMQAQPVVRQTSSEGTSVAVDAPNWSGLVAFYRSMSPIASATQAGPVLGVIPIPTTPHVRKVHMEVRDHYDNVDTDLS